MYKTQAKMLPRRKSVRAIFEPLYRTLPETKKSILSHNLGTKRSLTASALKKKGVGKGKPSLHVLKSKRQSKYSIVNIKSLSSKSRNNFVITNDQIQPQVSANSRSYHNVVPSFSNWNQFASSMSKRVENGWNSEDARAKQPISYEQSLNNPPLAVQFSKPLIQPRMGNSITTKSRRSSSFDTNSKLLKQDNPRGYMNFPNRDQEFRSLLDRLRAHFTLQDETFKNMSNIERLPLMIQHLVHFEKLILGYIDSPNPYPEAKIVLRDLRSRRAEIMSRLVGPSGLIRGKVPDINTITNPESMVRTFPTPKIQSQRSLKHDLEIIQSELLNRQSAIKKLNETNFELNDSEVETRSPPKTVTKKSWKKLWLNKLNPKKSPSSGPIIDRLYELPQPKDAVDGAIEIHKKLAKLAETIKQNSLLRKADSKIPNYSQTSPQPSLISTTGAVQYSKTEIDSPIKKLKLNKNDFTRLLPHPGEIPKNASKMMTEVENSRRLNKAFDSKIYMNWLEELMSHKLGQHVTENVYSSNTASALKKLPGSSAELPKWATIVPKNEDPVAKFKRAYKGFQKNASSMDTAGPRGLQKNYYSMEPTNVSYQQTAQNITSERTTQNTNEEICPNEKSAFHGQKHVDFTPQSMNRDLQNVGNTIRAILANPYNRQHPAVKYTAGPPVTNSHPKSMGIRFQETQEPSNAGATRKLPRLVFMHNNNMELSTLMNPKAIDQNGQDSQMTVLMANNIKGNFDTSNNYQFYQVAHSTDHPLSTKANVASANNLQRRGSSKTQTIYTAPTSAKRFGIQSNNDRQLGHLLDTSKQPMDFKVSKLRTNFQMKPARRINFPESLDLYSDRNPTSMQTM